MIFYFPDDNYTSVVGQFYYNGPMEEREFALSEEATAICKEYVDMLAMDDRPASDLSDLLSYHINEMAFVSGDEINRFLVQDQSQILSRLSLIEGRDYALR